MAELNNLTKLHDPQDGQMLVAGLMSGSGSNLRRIIELEKKLELEKETSPFRMAVIFSDRCDSNASKIGQDYDIPVIVKDLSDFCKERGKSRRDMQVRAEFDQETVKALAPYGVTVAAYGGYMSIATDPLIRAFLGVNVHPADLSVRDGSKRRYTGAYAVRKAILAGDKYIRSTTHLIEPEVDYGKILMISPPLEVKLGDNFNFQDEELVKREVSKNQDRLKEKGDWIIFPQTILYLAEGRFEKDKEGNLYFDGCPIPDGLKPED